MELDAALERYPAIAAEVWPVVSAQAAQDPQHPLRYLLTSDSQAAELVAIRTDRAVASTDAAELDVVPEIEQRIGSLRGALGVIKRVTGAGAAGGLAAGRLSTVRTDPRSDAVPASG